MGVGASTAAQLQAFRERLQVAGTAKTVWMTATLDEGRLRTVDVHRELTRQPFVGDELPLRKRLRAKKVLSRAGGRVGKRGSLGDLAREIAARHEPGTLTLVVVNRVARAQELNALLGNEMDSVALVHSRFRPGDRRRIQDAASNGSFQGVLVATQAIEAGVDLSAKTLFTELAPWPSLVQRFGRLNRAGEHEKSDAIWIDLDTGDADLCRPYEALVLATARERLSQLQDVSPVTLAEVPKDSEEPALPVLRRKDLLELFDTEPDLAGHDIDVSRYVRATDDRDIQVAWRAIRDSGPPDDAPDLQREELCSVPFYELEKLAKGKNVWRFDSLRKKWAKVERLFPGLAVVVDLSVGGYDDDLGFTCDKTNRPGSLEKPGVEPDADEADLLTYGAADYVTLRTHAEDTALEMTALLGPLGSLTATFCDEAEMVAAARWHDTGKVHDAFQAMLTDGLPPDDSRRAGGPWAKSDGKNRTPNRRRFFRHELASALAWLASGKSESGGVRRRSSPRQGSALITCEARRGATPGGRGPQAICPWCP